MQRRSFHPIVVMLTVFLVLAGLQTVAQPAAATTASVDVQTAGTGTGRVVSDRTGIACPPTCSATFPDPNPAPVTLTVTKSGAGTGNVTSDVAGINCGPDCDQAYAPGTLVTLTAAASVGSFFTGWSGGGCTGTSTCSVNLSAATTVDATFALPAFTLTVNKLGTGSGTVVSTPTGINCGGICSDNWVSGTSVALTANAATGSTFAGWGGACTGTGACSVALTADTTVTATFTPQTVNLTVSASGSGTGTVTSNPAGINCGTTCIAPYASGTVVSLTATPAVGSTFAGWGGACTGTGACNVTVTSATSVTAAFTLQTFTLGVVESGTGGGVVTSNPMGITCPGTCSASYAYGQVVVLTATPDGSSTFAGWSGGSCSGTGTCIVTIDTAKSVTATFDPTSSFTTASTSDTFVVTLTAIPAPGSYFARWSGGTCSGTAPTCTVTFADDGSVTAAAVTLVVATFNRIPNPPDRHGSPADDGTHHHRDCHTDPGYDPSNDPACRGGRQ